MWLNHTPLKAFLLIELNSDLRRCLTFKAFFFFCNVTHRHSLRFRPSHLSAYCCLSGHRLNRGQCLSICKAFLPVSTCQLFLWIPPHELSRISKANCGLFIFWILIISCLQSLLYYIWSCVVFSMCLMCLMASPTFTLTSWIDTKLLSSLGHKSV